MTPQIEQARKMLESELKLCKRIGISHHLPNKDMLYRIQALSLALRVLGRCNEDYITKVLHDKHYHIINRELAKAIITGLVKEE